MGLFSMLESAIAEQCAECGTEFSPVIQFHFGAQTLRVYRLDEFIEWGMNDAGLPGCARVAVKGYGHGCPHCGYDDEATYDIFIEDDVITSVRRESQGIGCSGEDWTVIDP
jgi:hypothetical protein